MPRAIAAHLRRSRALLEWISAEKRAAAVLWKSQKVGIWETIQARWWLSDRGIRLQFKVQDRNVVNWVSSIQSSPSGAKILMKNPRRSGSEVLYVVWDTPPAAVGSPLFDLWQAARQWIRRELPGCLIVAASQRADRAHTLSGSYLRLYARHCGSDYLLVACPREAPAELVSPLLSHGLHWANYLQCRRLLRGVPTIYLMAAAGRTAILYHRAHALNRQRVKAEVWDYTCRESGEWDTRRAPAPPPPEEERDFRWPVLGPFRWSPVLAGVLDLAPNVMRRHPRFLDYDSMRLWGLEFAQVAGSKRDRIRFGVGAQHTELVEDNFAQLRDLVSEIIFYRRPDSPDTHHPYYRMQAERWLECLILDDVPRLFPELAPEAVYSQIPLYLGRDAGRVDILGTDREGTLVVMELKVEEDSDLPLQALDYWRRVILHNLCGDFERRGYFAEKRLTRRRPKIYLVSPVFSFHDSTERILRYLDANLEVWKIALNEDWRSGVKILKRTRLRCGDLP